MGNHGSNTKYVGFWKSTDGNPNDKFTEMPIENSATYDQTSIIKKIRKLEKKAHCEHYRGYSQCRLCDKYNNGSKEYSIGCFVWPEGYIHYLEEHNVAVDEKFAKYAKSRM